MFYFSISVRIAYFHDWLNVEIKSWNLSREVNGDCDYVYRMPKWAIMLSANVAQSAEMACKRKLNGIVSCSVGLVWKANIYIRDYPWRGSRCDVERKDPNCSLYWLIKYPRKMKAPRRRKAAKFSVCPRRFRRFSALQSRSAELQLGGGWFNFRFVLFGIICSSLSGNEAK